MADVNYRWQGMPQQPSIGTNIETPSLAPTGEGMMQQAQREVDDRNAEIAQLQAELAQIDAQIAAFDRENPGIASGDIGVAASLMEAGNIAPYQQMVNNELGRRQMESSGKSASESTIWNNINEAKKLRWGLREADESMRQQTRDTIETLLDTAEREARKSGMSLPKEFYDLREELGGGDSSGGAYRASDDTIRAHTTRIEELVRTKRLRDKDIKELRDKANELSDNATEKEKLRALADKYENSTVEAEVRRNKAIKNAEVDMQNFVNATRNMTDAERMDAFNKAVRNGEKWTNYYTMNGGKLTAKQRQ